jgi:hypothetical protein
MELTDGVLHFEDVDGHSMVTMEDGYLTIANASTIRALLNVSGLTANRDYAFPNASGTLALTSDLSGYVPTSRTISTTSPLSGGGALSSNLTLSISQANTSTNGYLSSTDWNTFNNKQSALTFSSPLVNTSGTISIPVATTSVNGYLSSTDWNTFNNKQNALGFTPIGGSGSINYISKFTGSTTISQSGIYEGVTNYVSIGNTNTTYNLDVTGTARVTGDVIFGNAFTLTGSSFMDSMTHIKQVSVMYPSAGYTTIAGSSTGLTLNLGGAYNLGLIFPTAASYNYTYPAASGTLALTSQLSSGTVTSVALSAPTGFSVSGSPITTSGTLALSFATGYSLPTTASQTNWDTAYTNRITSLTTTGNSGSATLVSNTLNIPTYTLAGLGGISLTSLSATTPLSYNNTTGAFSISQATTSTNGYLSSTDWNTFNGKQTQLNGSGFVKASGTTISYDNTSYLPLTGGTLTGTTTFDGSGGTQNAITLVYSGLVNRLLTPIVRLYGATSIASNYVELLGTNATSNRTIQFPDASGTVALTSNLSGYVTGTATSGQVSYFNGTSSIAGSNNHFWDNTNNRLGIGTNAPAYPLHLKNATFAQLYIEGGNAADLILYNSGGSANVRTMVMRQTSSSYLSFFSANDSGTINTNNILNLTNSGDVCIGKTSYDNSTTGISLTGSIAGNIGSFVTDGGPSILVNRKTSTGDIVIIRYNNSGVGSISTNGTTTSYNITSDYRLKEDFKEINGLEKIAAIKVYDFKYKNSELRMDGVIAHELQDVLPYAVNGEKDAIDEEGKIQAQGVDYSKLVPVLVKAIQELKAEIDELKNKQA